MLMHSRTSGCSQHSHFCLVFQQNIQPASIRPFGNITWDLVSALTYRLSGHKSSLPNGFLKIAFTRLKKAWVGLSVLKSLTFTCPIEWLLTKYGGIYLNLNQLKLSPSNKLAISCVQDYKWLVVTLRFAEETFPFSQKVLLNNTSITSHRRTLSFYSYT